MSQTVLLGDEIELVYGKGLPQRDRIAGEYPVYGSNGQVDTHNIAIVEGPGIIVGRKGSAGEVAWSEKDFWPIDTTYYVKLKNPGNIRYWYYQLSILGLEELNSHSAIPGLNREIAYAKNVIKRTLEEQNEIATILGSIDEKIELNRRMNYALEQMGQSLFKHYFIDNPEADKWDQVNIGDIIEVTDFVANGSFASLKENVTLYDQPEYALYIRTTDYKGGFKGSLKYTDKKSYDFLGKSKLVGDEFIISNVGDVGTVFRPPVWLNQPMTLGSNAIMIKENVFNNYLYLYFKSDDGQFALSNIVAGSAQPKFNKTEFRGLKVKQPDINTLDRFNDSFKVIESLVFKRMKEDYTLINLRDTLLPRLMSEKLEL